ncbi:MAG: response regulator [Spirochaetaceae bacterium]|jgi:DNA-binding response OmpR family regulator|nr:response regulator [Spirochaetaceae bacterium]
MEKQKKILVAIDAEKRDFFSVMLGNLGYDVETAADGQNALEKIRKCVPDLVMASTVLPRLSGWELLSKLKEDEALKIIPVVLMSDIADVKDKVDAFEQGAEEYICSPFSFPEVFARIRSLLRTRELFNQLSARESRLSLAETLYADLKETIALFLKNIDNLDEAIDLTRKEVLNEKTLPAIVDLVHEKIRDVRSDAAGLDARIDKTVYKWHELKKKEISLSAFEKGEKLD